MWKSDSFRTNEGRGRSFGGKAVRRKESIFALGQPLKTATNYRHSY